MSGSSLDGLDICYSRIDVRDNVYTYEILDSDTIPYPIDLLDKLKVCRELSSIDLYQLDVDLGFWYGDEILQFWQRICKGELPPTLFVVSHGHTVFHYPENQISIQIGNGQIMAEQSGFKCITQLRQKDVVFKGSGAPIVPIGDLLLFHDYKYCLNLGGIMNISVKEKDSIIAYDIGACNQVINHYAQLRGLDYDKNGDLARKGLCIRDLFDKLNTVEYFHKPYPKSLDNGFSAQIISILDSFDISIEDKLHTFYHHICHQISICIDSPTEKILSTGGGTHNKFLIELLKTHYILNITVPDKTLIDNKEALVMSLMGVRYMEHKINVLSSVTGAYQDTMNGQLFYPE